MHGLGFEWTGDVPQCRRTDQLESQRDLLIDQITEWPPLGRLGLMVARSCIGPVMSASIRSTSTRTGWRAGHRCGRPDGAHRYVQAIGTSEHLTLST